MSHFVAKSSPVGRNWLVNNAHNCRNGIVKENVLGITTAALQPALFQIAWGGEIWTFRH